MININTDRATDDISLHAHSNKHKGRFKFIRDVTTEGINLPTGVTCDVHEYTRPGSEPGFKIIYRTIIAEKKYMKIVDKGFMNGSTDGWLEVPDE